MSTGPSPARPGRLHGVGVGPGDPELITRKGARLIAAADVVAYHSGTAGRSIARAVAGDLVRADAVEELLVYPVTTGTTDHPLGYYGAVGDFYDASAARLAAHLDAGRDVVVLAEGDPMFYSSYSYLHDRLSDRYACEVVPGVTSISAATAALATPVSRHEDVLTVLPGTLGVPELARRLAGTDAAAIMKLGRTFAGVLEALRQAGRLDDALYVERASTEAERVVPVTQPPVAARRWLALWMVQTASQRTFRSIADRQARRSAALTCDLREPGLQLVDLEGQRLRADHLAGEEPPAVGVGVGAGLDDPTPGVREEAGDAGDDAGGVRAAQGQDVAALHGHGRIFAKS